jgi:hypothetical protein
MIPRKCAVVACRWKQGTVRTQSVLKRVKSVAIPDDPAIGTHFRPRAAPAVHVGGSAQVLARSCRRTAQEKAKMPRKNTSKNEPNSLPHASSFKCNARKKLQLNFGEE